MGTLRWRRGHVSDFTSCFYSQGGRATANLRVRNTAEIARFGQLISDRRSPSTQKLPNVVGFLH